MNNMPTKYTRVNFQCMKFMAWKGTWDADDIHVREVILQVVQHVLDALGDHVHPHGIPSAAGEPHVQVPPSHRALDTLQPCESAWSVSKKNMAIIYIVKLHNQFWVKKHWYGHQTVQFWVRNHCFFHWWGLMAQRRIVKHRSGSGVMPFCCASGAWDCERDRQWRQAY